MAHRDTHGTCECRRQRKGLQKAFGTVFGSEATRLKSQVLRSEAKAMNLKSSSGAQPCKAYCEQRLLEPPGGRRGSEGGRFFAKRHDSDMGKS